MIVGVAVVPAAPMFVPGLSRVLPPPLEKVRRHSAAAVASLPPADLAVAVTARARQGVYLARWASLAGAGVPSLRRALPPSRVLAERVTEITQYPLLQGEGVPLDAAVLVLHLPAATAPLPLVVPAGASFGALTGVGMGVAEALGGQDVRCLVLASGDLSTALTEASPRPLVAGASAWDERVVAEADTGRLHGLAALGPAEASRVHAPGWAALSVLHGVLERARLGLVLRHYSAPRGVGYLVAQGA